MLNNLKKITLILPFITLLISSLLISYIFLILSKLTSSDNANEIMSLDEFKRSGSFLSDKVKPRTIKSIGVVAFGRDHVANLYVKEISFIK